MLFLHFRGKKYLDLSKKMTHEAMKPVLKSFIHHNYEKFGFTKLDISKKELLKNVDEGKITIDYGNLHHLSIMEDLREFCHLLHNKYWKVYISREGNFITTDAPYLDMPTSKSFWGNDFLSREQSFILSPKIMILALYPETSNKKFARKDISKNKGLIQQLNIHNLMNAIRFGFHKDRELLLELNDLINLIYKYKTELQIKKI